MDDISCDARASAHGLDTPTAAANPRERAVDSVMYAAYMCTLTVHSDSVQCQRVKLSRPMGSSESDTYNSIMGS